MSGDQFHHLDSTQVETQGFTLESLPFYTLDKLLNEAYFKGNLEVPMSEHEHKQFPLLDIPMEVDHTILEDLQGTGGIVILDVGMRRVDHSRITRALAVLEQLEHLSPEEKEAIKGRIISVVPNPREQYIGLEESINISRMMEDMEDMKQCYLEPKPSKKIPRNRRYNSPNWNF